MHKKVTNILLRTCFRDISQGGLLPVDVRAWRQHRLGHEALPVRPHLHPHGQRNDIHKQG